MITIEPFDTQHSSADGLLEFYQVAVAAFAKDRPDAPAQTYEAVIGRLRNPLPGLGRQRVWLARRDGHMVGCGIAWLPEFEATSMAFVELRVHPELRGQGIGKALAHAVFTELRTDNRTMIGATGVTAGGDGDRWATAMGFREVQRFLLQRLTIAEVDPATWQVPAPPGYRLRRWRHSAPDDVVAGYAYARRAMVDQPMGQSSYEVPDWSTARVRAEEAEVRNGGVEQRVVVAVHEATGEVAGVTVVQLHPDQPDLAFQNDTGVLASHRGHGLGVAMKAAMMRWLTAECPQIQQVGTSTDATNTHMIRVNAQLGYQPKRTMIEFEADVDTLLDKLKATTT